MNEYGFHAEGMFFKLQWQHHIHPPFFISMNMVITMYMRLYANWSMLIM